MNGPVRRRRGQVVALNVECVCEELWAVYVRKDAEGGQERLALGTGCRPSGCGGGGFAYLSTGPLTPSMTVCHSPVSGHGPDAQDAVAKASEDLGEGLGG